MNDLSPYKSLEDGIKSFENTILGSFYELDNRLKAIESSLQGDKKSFEEKEQEYFQSLKILANATKGFVELPKYGDIYQYIGEQLSRLTDDSFVIISSFDRSSFEIDIRATIGSEKFRDILSDKIGKPVIGTCFELPEAAALNLAGGNLFKHEIEKGFGALPRHIYKEISDELQIKSVYEIGLSYEDELFGNAILFSSKPIIEKHEIAESFIRQASVALKKKKADELLKENNEFLTLTLKSISDAVIAINKSGYIFYLNPKAEEISGWKLSNAKGRHFKDIFKLFNAASGLPIENAADSAFKNGKISELNGNIRVISKNNQEFNVSENISYLKNENDELVGLAIILREEKKWQPAVGSQQSAEKNDEQKKKNESDREKLGYFSYLSHEIRAPLNAIIGFSEILAEEVNNKDHEEYINIIKNCSNDILKITDDILDIAKLEAGKATINKMEFNIIDMLNELKDIYKTIIQRSKNPDIELRLNKSVYNESLIVDSDPDRIKQIFRNLIGNAIKFTKEGFIEFGIWQTEENNTLKFYVKDTGTGIPSDRQQAIFKPFEQTEGTKNQGTGLGLPISRKLTEAMGGKMWVESGYNGSTFFFTIPFTVKKETPATELASDDIIQPLAPSPYDWSDRLILVVEDIESHQKLIEGLLMKSGAKFTFADNGSDAIEQCRKNDNINVVLMDIQLPGIDGYVATKEIKKIRKDLPVIAVTAYGIPDGKDEIIINKFDGFLEKPYKTDDLFEIINEHINVVSASS